jgi:DNA repair protein RecO (recombination protein O)
MSEARQRLYRTEGVIIRRSNVGEADRILTVFTPGNGKLRVVAKGVRRSRSRLSGHVELLSHSTFLIARARNLDIITQAQTLHAYGDLRRDLERIGWGCHLAELVDRMTPEQAENYPVFQLLLEALDELDQGKNAELVARSFELHLLGYLGYRPQIFRCVACDRELEPRAHAFSTTLGGILCPQCRGEDRRAQPLSLEALKVLRFLQRHRLQEVERLNLGNGCRAEIEDLLHRYVRTILERDLHSAGFLDTLRRRLSPQLGGRYDDESPEHDR